MPNRLWIFCADIGSVKAGRFGWFGMDTEERPVPGSTIEELAEAVKALIDKGEKVALGFECPLYVPLRKDPMLLTTARTGEGNRSWSAGAGCGALATGLVEVTWLLAQIRSPATNALAFLDWGKFDKASGGLFLWEAFISGKAKGRGHAEDAEIAVRTFRAALPDPESTNAVTAPELLSLIGASMVRTGWSTDAELLATPCLVIKAKLADAARLSNPV